MKTPFYKFDKESFIKKSKYSKFQDFHNLMRFRVRDILLVSSLYDSFIFEEDGRLYELIRQEYQGLNLSHSPELIQVANGEEAIKMAKMESRFNLIIATLHIEDMHTISFAQKAKEAGLEIPIILLGYDNREMAELMAHHDLSAYDKIFMWQGNFRIILGIIKYLEDKINVESDTQKIGVQSIILIEDNIRFYSSYLPMIYMEFLQQSQYLISEGINLTHKFLRMRARPKILLCTNYEEAWEYFEKYEETILGIISDIDFKRQGEQDPQAGIIFAKNAKKVRPDIPILLQSNVPENAEAAEDVNAAFLLKDSPTLLRDLRTFMKQNFSLGAFVFRKYNGEEVGRAKNLLELEDQLKKVPEESIRYHAERNNFSNWLKARTEFWLAHQLRPRQISDYPSIEALRNDLINAVHDFRASRQKGIISDFNAELFNQLYTFARIGGGSLGGKARGLGFINNLLSNFEMHNRFENVSLYVPPGVVIGTEVFDQFLDENDLRNYALHSTNDDELYDRFVAADIFPDSVIEELINFLEIIKDPLAVRSSSLLEDSQGQPFAGVYETIMIPNCHADIKVRLNQLLNSIKKIYASTYCQKAKDYIRVTSYRLEEEKMAVIIQKMVGANHNGKFYPEISGVAKSHNFYPIHPLKSTDGIVSVALGLGRTVVEGGMTVRFCPKYPHHLMQFSTIKDTLRYSQQKFYALEIHECLSDPNLSHSTLMQKFDIDEADEDGTLGYIGSTYSPENNAIYDGISRSGQRLITFSSILKYRVFPLPEIVQMLLEMGSWGMGSPVEIEFAINLTRPKPEVREFALLQIRPLVISNELEELNIDDFEDESLLCKSENALGNGTSDDLRDIILVDRETFDRSKSNDVAMEISEFNKKLIAENRRYLLIGVGRWGSLDPWLGVPVRWEQISGAKAIIESNFKDFNVQLSQGTHFFQNLTSFKVGYFTINSNSEKDFIDWEWLGEQQSAETKKFSRHIHLDEPISIKINGQRNSGIIVKPNGGTIERKN